VDCEAGSPTYRLTSASPPLTLRSPELRVGASKSGVEGVSGKRTRRRKLFFFPAKSRNGWHGAECPVTFELSVGSLLSLECFRSPYHALVYAAQVHGFDFPGCSNPQSSRSSRLRIVRSQLTCATPDEHNTLSFRTVIKRLG
jgi:hypothetical protein